MKIFGKIYFLIMSSEVENSEIKLKDLLREIIDVFLLDVVAKYFSKMKKRSEGKRMWGLLDLLERLGWGSCSKRWWRYLLDCSSSWEHPGHFASSDESGWSWLAPSSGYRWFQRDLSTDPTSGIASQETWELFHHLDESWSDELKTGVRSGWRCWRRADGWRLLTRSIRSGR